MASPDPSVPLFRPNKKRRLYRQRAADEDEEEDITAIHSPPPQSLDELIASASSNANADALSMAEILRLRKQRKAKTGMEFRPTGTVRDEEQRTVREKEEGDGPTARFAPQTGTVGDVNKHM